MYSHLRLLFFPLQSSVGGNADRSLAFHAENAFMDSFGHACYEISLSERYDSMVEGFGKVGPGFKYIRGAKRILMIV